MTSLAASFPDLAVADDSIPVATVLAPRTEDEAAAVFAAAAKDGVPLVVWGAGTQQGLGGDVDADVAVVSRALPGEIQWSPDDLTVVAGAGVGVAALEERLAARGQSAVLRENPGSGTIGGAVASGRSGWRRLRYGPTRDRVLEVRLVSGDGRIVRGGGQVVKNVTGYDIPRLVAGSLGSLGLITRVCLKLWPIGTATQTIRVGDPFAAAAHLYRPLAVIGDRFGGWVYLAGTEEDVADVARSLGGEGVAGLVWPPDPTGELAGLIRVPPGELAQTLQHLPTDFDYLAGIGVGEVRFAGPAEPGAVTDLRQKAEAVGGSLLVTSMPPGVPLDPWGAPPTAIELQRRVKAAFDPRRVCNPGRLPGGL